MWLTYICVCGYRVQAAAVTHILNSLHLIKSPQHTSQGTYGRFLSALEDSTDAPKLLGVLSDAYERKQAKFEEAAAEAKTKGDVPPLTPTIPMALRAAVHSYIPPSL